MTWNVEWDDRARRELRSLDTGTQRKILRYLRERIATPDDPRRFGRGLTGDKAGLWRYRVGDYRLICRIEIGTLIVLVLTVGHRATVYDRDLTSN